MTDIEYMLFNDAREKKACGRGDRNKRRQGGKHVHFQNDYMSRKEWSKMNGKVKSYDIGKVMTWKEFRALPNDIAEEYLERIRKYFPNVSQLEICKAMGVTPANFRRGLKGKGISGHFQKGGAVKETRDFCNTKIFPKWQAWVAGEISFKEVDEFETSETETTPETENVIVEEKIGNINVENVKEEENVIDTPDISETIKSEMTHMTLADIVAELRALGVSAEISINIKV